MKKGKMIFFSVLLMSCFLAVPAEAKSVEKDTYCVCKNDISIIEEDENTGYKKKFTEMTGLYVDEETDLDFFDEETMYDEDSSDTDIGSGQYVYEYDMADGSHLYLCGSELSVLPTTIYIVDADGKTTQIK